MSEKMYKFVIRSGTSDREYPSIKEVFENKKPNEEAGIILVATSSFYRVQRP
jgi:hypothetical protein